MKDKDSTPPEQFVKAWQSSSSAAEVAEKLKTTKHAVVTRAARYRKAGVRLKKMIHSMLPLDIDALNKLCK